MKHASESRRLTQTIKTLLPLGALCLFAPFSLGESVPEIQNVRQIRALSPQQAASERPVHLRGVVTARSGWKSSFFLQDATSGISIDRLDTASDVQAGQLVDLIGRTGAGKFAPIVKATSVKVLGAARMPAPHPVGANQLAGGSLDSQWATIQGVVRTAVIKPLWGQDVLVLDLDIGNGTLVTARVRNFAGDSWHRFPAAIVSIRGVCGTVFNDRRQYIGSRFFVTSLSDVKIIRSGPKDLFDRPLQTLDSIGRFSYGKSAFIPIKVQGTVTYSLGHGRLYIQDGSEGVLVETSQDSHMALGSQVEVVGYARDGDYSPALEGATMRVKETNHLTRSIRMTPHDLIVEKDGFVSSPYDALLIRLSGVLMEVVSGTEEQVLSIRNGKDSFTARLPADSSSVLNLPAIGSVVEVTGICVTKVDNAREPRGFKILLRSSSDVTVLKDAPWWTAEHAKMVVAAMGVVLLLMTILLGFFRREAALRQLSLSDPLTGVHNRRGFVLLAEQQWKIARRNNLPMLIFYVDVDRFKQINDTFGHKQGDVALQQVAALLQQCFRSTDIVGRLGGDEFAVVACDAHYQSEASLQERLAGMVEESNCRSTNAFHLSLSMGALLCDQSAAASSLEDLLAQTDALMYEQKAIRKNQARLLELAMAEA